MIIKRDSSQNEIMDCAGNSHEEEEDDDFKLSSLIVKKENLLQVHPDRPIVAQSHLTTHHGPNKRRRIATAKMKEAKLSVSSLVKQEPNNNNNNNNNNGGSGAAGATGTSNKQRGKNKFDRWSQDRYKLAQHNMLEILKAEGAVFGNPISRQALRVAARKRIGDTGLLDHLLKHIDGKLAPGGTERFRRWHNTNGVMEYWLESADLDDIRQKVGVNDPYWTPPSGWKPGEKPQLESVSIDVLKEMSIMKSEMLQVVSKKLNEEKSNVMEEMRKEFIQWNSVVDKCILEVKCSLSSVQGMCKDMMTWKTNFEKQLMEISDAVSSMQPKKECTNDQWENWLESANLENIPGEFAPWLENSGLLDVGQENGLQGNILPETELRADANSSLDPVYIRELNMLKEEVTKLKRDMQELVSRKEEEDQPNGTPESAITANSKLDLDNISLLQDMYNEMANWKAKVEMQLINISKAVGEIQGQRQFHGINP